MRHMEVLPQSACFMASFSSFTTRREVKEHCWVGSAARAKEVLVYYNYLGIDTLQFFKVAFSTF